MSVASDILSQALSLPVAERAAIAHELLQSLPAEDDLPVVADEELEATIARRIENHRLGQAKSVDFETFKRTLRDAASGHAAP